MAKCNSATIAPAVPAQITTTVNFHAARAQYKLIEYGVEVSLSGVVTADAFHSLLSAALAAVDKVQVLVIRTDKALTCFDAVPLPPISASRGRLLVVALIQSGGHKLDVALVKQHTGGGFTSARGLHENPFTFEITHKVVLMTNHKPSLDHMDEAMRGRLHILPFDMCWNRPGHPDRDPNLPDGDKLLPEKLKAEAEGILAWLIAGAVLYHQEGLEPPPEVAIMTREYFKDQDTFRQWLDSCETCEPKDGMRASDLLTDYESWCIDEGHGRAVAGNATSFGGKLKTAGIAKAATNTGKRYGLRAGKDGHRRGVDPLLA